MLAQLPSYLTLLEKKGKAEDENARYNLGLLVKGTDREADSSLSYANLSRL